MRDHLIRLNPFSWVFLLQVLGILSSPCLCVTVLILGWLVVVVSLFWGCPSLIILMVSVDVKHHIYLLTVVQPVRAQKASHFASVCVLGLQVCLVQGC